jgi:LysM repeat protein
LLLINIRNYTRRWFSFPTLWTISAIREVFSWYKIQQDDFYVSLSMRLILPSWRPFSHFSIRDISGFHKAWQPLSTKLSAGFVLLATFLVGVGAGFPQPSALGSGKVWGAQPVLSYFMLTPSLYSRISEERILDGQQFQDVQQIARQEDESLRQMEQESRGIVQDSRLSLQQKRQRITLMGYNQRVDRIVADSQQAVQQSLDARSYPRFVDWIERRWQVERALHGSPLKGSNPRSYQIYATRFDAGTRYIVALPDKCVKFANGGSHICDSDGYSVGQGYSVIISYKKGVGVVVGDSGPWNVDDNYWSRLSDPQPRRMFADLGLGMPEAQAAFFNGYNGGKDQFGRKVTAPFGIDLARQVSIDIGLQPGVNDWITVSFLWTAGWDGGSAAVTLKPGAPGTPAATSGVINPLQTVTPNPDGSIVHVVQPNEALWSIAIAYGVTIQAIRDLNKLSASAVIIPGQKLVIRQAGPTVTPSLGTPTLDLLTASPTSLASPSPTASPEPVATSSISTGSSVPSTTAEAGQKPARKPIIKLPQGNAILILSLVLLALGVVLLVVGKILS